MADLLIREYEESDGSDLMNISEDKWAPTIQVTAKSLLEGFDKNIIKVLLAFCDDKMAGFIYGLALPNNMLLPEFMYEDPDFIEMNERGRRMYSAGLNNYYRFASGEGLILKKEDVLKMDIPLTPDQPIKVEQTVWKRSNILRMQALTIADFSCEIDRKHESFTAEKTGKPYMEGHHAIPMRLQSTFDRNLDVYANIVCLCPVCHRKIHFGMKNEKTRMIHQIYEERAERLAHSGINLSRDEFTNIAIRNPAI